MNVYGRGGVFLGDTGYDNRNATIRSGPYGPSDGYAVVFSSVDVAATIHTLLAERRPERAHREIGHDTTVRCAAVLVICG